MRFREVLIALLFISPVLSMTRISTGAAAGNPIYGPEQSQPPTTFASWGAWRGYMSHNPTSGRGCFEGKYPNPVWQQTTCAAPISGHETPPHRLVSPSTSQVGDGNDFVAESSSTLIASATGSFLSVTGLTSETDVCVPPFLSQCTYGGEGPNAYSLQVNAIEGFPVTFNGWTGTGWQQFVFDNTPAGGTDWIEYWLFNYLATNTNCPGSVSQNPTDGGPWFSSGNDCVWNTASTSTPYEPPTSLSSVSLEAFANLNSLDEGQLCITGGSCYTKSEPAGVLNLYQQWRLAEFNVFGYIDGSQAQFNAGTTITVETTLADQSGNAITPVAPCPNAGQTGETNNLNLGSCTATANAIVFSESNAPCGTSSASAVTITTTSTVVVTSTSVTTSCTTVYTTTSGTVYSPTITSTTPITTTTMSTAPTSFTTTTVTTTVSAGMNWFVLLLPVMWVMFRRAFGSRRRRKEVT